MEKIVKKYIYFLFTVSIVASISYVHAMAEVEPESKGEISPNAYLLQAISRRETIRCITLLQQGADPNARYAYPEHAYHDQQTPLHAAVYYSQPKIVEILLAAGANPNAVDANNQTPLHWIALCNNSFRKITTSLVKAGAKKDAQNKDGDIPIFKRKDIGQYFEIILCQPPVTMTSARRQILFTFLCVHKCRPNSPIKKLSKDVILNHIFPYVCPWFPFTSKMVGEYVNLQFQQAKRLLLIKNNKGETVRQRATINGWDRKMNDPCRAEIATICDPEKVKQHEWLIEKNIRALNPRLKQLEQEEHAA